MSDSTQNTSDKKYCSFHEGVIVGPAISVENGEGDSATVQHLCAECAFHTYNKLKDTGRLRHLGVSGPMSLTNIKSVVPRSIKEALDARVVGQDRAKIMLATAFAKHVQRIKNKSDLIKKFNPFIFGPTGTGKTEMISTLAKVAGLPFIEVDTSGITPSGIKGDSVEDFLRRIYMAANQNLELAQHGIIYLDELDKMIRAGGNDSLFGNDIQKSLLKACEGGDFEIRLSPQHPPVVISTRDMMFIGSGAFVGLEKTVAADRSVGIAGNVEVKKDDNWQEKIGSDQLIAYGLMPEFVGRFSSFGFTKDLTKEQMKQILTGPEGNAVEYFVNLFSGAGAHLILENDYLDFIVEKASKDKTGVRSLQKHLSDTMDPIFFEIDSMVGKIVRVSGEGTYTAVSPEESNLLINLDTAI